MNGVWSSDELRYVKRKLGFTPRLVVSAIVDAKPVIVVKGVVKHA